MKYYLAIDLGASSGRHIVGWRDENGVVHDREVYRFPNGNDILDGHLVWDVERLFREIKSGIKAAFALYPEIESLSVDTWGVDYVLLDGESEILPCHAYRDSRTESAIEKVHSLVPFSRLYEMTGCQFQPFTTIYQLYSDLMAGRLENATDFLAMPQYFLYKLTGVKSTEYTHATTTGLVNAKTGEFDLELVRELGLPERLFGRISQPGTILGELLPEIAAEVGGSCRAVLCASHDTGSAVEGIPMEENSPYISSGTWSLLGVKTEQPITTSESEQANYSNEGGVGYNRYQKNIMGLWLSRRIRDELCPDKDYDLIESEAETSDFAEIIDTNSSDFLAPESMTEAIRTHLASRGKAVPVSEQDYFKCCFVSLAESYRIALEELENNTGKKYDKLYIVGGGAKNKFLNALTEKASGKQVIALPIEATSLGNLKIQMEL